MSDKKFTYQDIIKLLDQIKRQSESAMRYRYTISADDILAERMKKHD